MFGVMIHRGKDTYKEFQKLIKYLDQWYFIEKTWEFVGKVFERPTILKKAKGKFGPWSEAAKWYFSDLNI